MVPAFRDRSLCGFGNRTLGIQKTRDHLPAGTGNCATPGAHVIGKRGDYNSLSTWGPDRSGCHRQTPSGTAVSALLHKHAPNPVILRPKHGDHVELFIRESGHRCFMKEAFGPRHLVVGQWKTAVQMKSFNLVSWTLDLPSASAILNSGCVSWSGLGWRVRQLSKDTLRSFW